MSSDSDKLSCLLYVSTATQDFRNEYLGDILEEAREQNEKNQITGLLIYCRKHFI